ncbi:MAG TPA: hypothetical protein VI391_00815 [Thermoanaerobaculia bacterium]
MGTLLFLATISIFRMGGDISVPNAPNGASLRTMGGDIVVQRGGGNVVAKTMGGNIEIGSLVGSAEAGTMGGDVRITVDGNGPGHDVDLWTLGGNIVLILPANFDGKFDVTVEEGDGGERGEITSDFPLNMRQSTRYRLFGGSHIVHTATGRNGSGVNRVHIRTIGGNITIRKK